MVDEWKLPNGDITEKDVQEFERLNSSYAAFDRVRDIMERRVQARCLLMFAHGYLMIGIEEAADKYMQDHYDICPEYLDEYLKEDMEKFFELDKAARDLADWYQEKFQGLI